MQTITSSQKKNHVYDYAIIGSGLTGLLIAKNLNRISNNILVIESGDFAGGLNRAIKTPAGLQNNGLRFLPNTELTRKGLQFLDLTLGKQSEIHFEDLPPVHFESGSLKPFIGFGENPPAFYDQINLFAHSQNIKYPQEIYTWTQELFDAIEGDFSARSYVTKLQVEEAQVSQIMINGQKTVQAQNVIYTGPVKALKNLLPEGILSAKALGKLSKNSYWTAVCLDLLHAKIVTSTEAMHILNGTTDDEFGPCAGHFQVPIEIDGELRQYSQWISFVDDDSAEDTEVIGTALKKIKRQIQRAYSDCMDNLLFERILVVNSYAGHGDLKLSGNLTLPNLKNLWIGSPTVNSQPNLLGALLQAEMIVSALGCHPLGAQIEILPEVLDLQEAGPEASL